MNFIAIGISHQKTHIEERESFTLSTDKVKDFQISLYDYCGNAALVVLSTCNRVEIYIAFEDEKVCLQNLKNCICDRFNVSIEYVNDHFYILQNDLALEHLFKVVSGLDSQILGEIEILRQVKSAWVTSQRLGYINNFLDNIFYNAVKIGVEVRRSTGISRGNVSIGSIATKMLKEYYSDIRDKKVLIIGAGKIARTMTKYLKKEKVEHLFFCNRSKKKAADLVEQYGGEVIEYDLFHERLCDMDIVVAATSSACPIIDGSSVMQLSKCKNKKIVFLDLSVPRDIDVGVRSVKNIVLYDLDDLTVISEENYANRQKQVVKVEKMIKKRLDALSLMSASYK